MSRSIRRAMIDRDHQQLSLVRQCILLDVSRASVYYRPVPTRAEEPSPEGLGGHDLLTQADARCPTGQVMRHRLDGQPGVVGGEAARGAMVEADAVLEVAYRIPDLGVAAVASVVASIRCSFSGVGFLFQNHYPRSTGAPSYRFRTLTRRPPSVNSG